MEQVLRQGCVLAPLLFNIFFAAVINVASTNFKTDKDLMNAFVHLRKKRGAGGRGEATAGELVLATPFWGMLYADDAGVVWRSPEQLKRMMRVIMVVCAAFGLAVSKGMPDFIATFSVEVAGQVYTQTNAFVYLRGRVNYKTDLSVEVDRRIRNSWGSFRKYTLELYFTRCIGWRKHNRAEHPISYLHTLIETGRESIEATLRRRQILFARFLARMVDTRRRPKCVIFGELVGGAGCARGQEKERMGLFLDDLRAFGINGDQWTTAAQDEREWHRAAEQGAEHLMAKWNAATKTKAGLRHAIVCPNVTGRTKERIAQSKRARAGLLAIVD